MDLPLVNIVKDRDKQRSRCRHQRDHVRGEVLVGSDIGHIHQSELNAADKHKLQTVQPLNSSRPNEG